MKKLQNTLYVTTEGAYLAREGECLLVRIEQETRLRVPIHSLSGIVCFGRASCSPSAMGLCAERNVAISFLSTHGRFLARVEGRLSGNVLLRREQYRRADDPRISAELARVLVAAKIVNARAVLQRSARDRPDSPAAAGLREGAAEMQRSLDQLHPRMTLDAVRGVEGKAAAVYFRVFDLLIVSQKEDFAFHARSRRPPLDKVNALLSFVYTLLTHDIASALSAVGLDPAVGYLHRDRPGRPGLALDVLEEFRAFLGDRLVLSLINLRQVQAGGFRVAESGAVRMDDATRKTLLVAYQKRKQEEIRHPFLEETIPVGLLFHAQALLMARFLRGDLDAYPPFFWK